MITNKIIHFKTYAAFNQQLQNGNISDNSVVLIKDTKQIYSHGQFYGDKYDTVFLTQAEYDDMDSHDENTIYFILAGQQ